MIRLRMACQKNTDFLFYNNFKIISYVSICYYSDATWPSWCYKSPETGLFAEQLEVAYDKDNTKALH